MAKEDKAQWHRLGGYVLSPLFKLMGYDTYVEVDLAEKKQLVDIIVVRRKEVTKVPLPEIYWQAFGELNEHNLISFKSYSESFNAFAMEEFFGHLANYQKIHKLPAKKVNLYVLSHHYPRKLLKPFESFITVVKENEIFDLKLGQLHAIRFMIMRETDHPILGLFSAMSKKSSRVMPNSRAKLSF